MNSASHFRLGLLLLAALALLGWFTIGKSDFTLFGDVQRLVVQFPNADGLRDGDAVLVSGVRWGKVDSLVYDPAQEDLDRRITVTISLDAPIELREGHSIEIQDATLLGGKHVWIDPGPATGAALPGETVFAGTVQLNVIEAAGELITSNQDAVGEAIDGLRDLVRGVRDGRGTAGRLFTDEGLADDVERAVASFADTGENLRELSDRLKSGEGTLGKLFADDEMYTSLKGVADDLQTLIDAANETIAEARAGKGTVGLLLADEATRTDVQEGLKSLREILDRANRGEGTVGKLLVEDAIADDIATVARRLAEGEGTLGRLMAEDQLYRDLEAVAADLADVVATVRDGRGTVGKLVMEEQLYYEIVKAVGLLTRSLEEYREAAPIGTFTNVIFGAF
jgi:phospholipid/cholesterol/gamma-HCH transport system substrate-binding protein